MNYEIETKVIGTKIFQELTLSTEIEGVRDMITRDVMDTGDKQLREALIGLGWTPPKDA